MVSTRHRPSLSPSLPIASSSNTKPAAEEEEESPSLRRLKQKLAINATSTLGGTQKALAERNTKSLGTYMSRGAVYELEDNTPREWIEKLGSEVGRRKRRRRTEGGEGEGEEGDGKRRRVTFGGEGEKKLLKEKKEETSLPEGAGQASVTKDARESSSLRGEKSAMNGARRKSIGRPRGSQSRGRARGSQSRGWGGGQSRGWGGRWSAGAAMTGPTAPVSSQERRPPIPQGQASHNTQQTPCSDQKAHSSNQQASRNDRQPPHNSPRKINPPLPPRSQSPTPTNDDLNDSDSGFSSDEEEFSSTNLHLHQQSLSRSIAHSRSQAKSKNYAVEMLPSSEIESFAEAAAVRQKAAIERLARNLAEMSRLNGKMEKLRGRFEGGRERGEWSGLLKVARDRNRVRKERRSGEEDTRVEGVDSASEIVRSASTVQKVPALDGSNDTAVTPATTEQRSDAGATPTSITTKDTTNHESLLRTSSPASALRQDTPLEAPLPVPQRKQFQPEPSSSPQRNSHNARAIPPRNQHEPILLSPVATTAPSYGRPESPAKSSFVALVTNPLPATSAAGPAATGPPPPPPRYQSTSPLVPVNSASHWITTSQYVRTTDNITSAVSDYGAGYVRSRPVNPALSLARATAEQVPRNSRAFSEDGWCSSRVGAPGAVGPGAGAADDERRLRMKKEAERRNMEMWRVVG
jgi:hypothetical protein